MTTGSKQLPRRSRANQVKNMKFYCLLLLCLSGDIAVNPGPAARKWKFPCKECAKPVKSNDKGLQCDSCDIWCHLKCVPDAIKISPREYDVLANTDTNWYCYRCIIPDFNDSFFSNKEEQNDSVNNVQNNDDSTNSTNPLYEGFIDLRKRNSGNFIVSHININSLQYKWDELREILEKNLVDCLFVAETKLNTSHVDGIFEIPNYHKYRKDNIADNGGGLICFIRSDIPSREEIMDSSPCENLTIIAHIQGEKWTLMGTYRKPSLPERHINSELETVIDKCLDISPNIIILGDLNCNMLSIENNAVKTLCDDLNLTNVITKPTCHKTDPPTLLDVILVSNSDKVKSSKVTPCALSDFHDFVTLVLNAKTPRKQNSKVKYRSYKHFDESHFRFDLEKAPFHVAECLDVDDQCAFITTLFNQVLEDHAPTKMKTIKSRQCPYMNSEWRKAIHKKHQLLNRYRRQRTQENWANFRKQRNYCQKLKRRSIANYMQEKCTNSKEQPREFWKTVSPYLSDKSRDSGGIQLLDGENFTTNPSEVAEIFNKNFATIADKIGQDSPYRDNVHDHPSMQIINNHMRLLNVDEFNFSHTNVIETEKILKGLNPYKATGYDGIPPKVLKLSSDVMAPTVCNAVNNMITQCKFPDSLKRAEVAPIFKAKSRLEWSNFRPVSVLSCLSKIFEIIMAKQMRPHLEQIYSKHLSAYREKFGCHSVLTHAIEIWKQALDDKQYVGILMSDLSKAFDCLPHNILVEKLKHYRFSANSQFLIHDYLSRRCQRVKIQNVVSSWEPLSKGVPQGSIVGPLCFNLYINDLLLLLENEKLMPSNYADDNTVTIIESTKDEVVNRLKYTVKLLASWFKNNLMKANIDKFQMMILHPNIRNNDADITIQVDGVTIKSQNTAKLLGITIDRELKFDNHVKTLCNKANAKVQILKRLSRFLSPDCRLSVVRSFVISQFLYCSILFLFCRKFYVNRMDKIVHRALRVVYNDYSATYDELLTKAEIDSLDIQRQKALICEIFRSIINVGPVYMKDIFTIRKEESRRGLLLAECRTRTSAYGTHSIRALGPKLWNNLSVDIKASKSITELKQNLKNYTGIKCRCALCR